MGLFKKVEPVKRTRVMEAKTAEEKKDSEELDEELWIEGVDGKRPVGKESVESAGNASDRHAVRDSGEFARSRVKKLYLDLVVDTTLSFSSAYLKVFYVLRQFLLTLENRMRDYKGIQILYGLTVFQEKGRQIPFPAQTGETCFTESSEEVLKALRKLEFAGGSKNGRENLKGALQTGLQALNQAGDGRDYRGILFFTDSLPQEEDAFPNFRMEELGEDSNLGLRFAQIYSYDASFRPRLRMVDREGDLVENGRNEARFISLKELLSLRTEDIVSEVSKQVEDILNEVSVIS